MINDRRQGRDFEVGSGPWRCAGLFEDLEREGRHLEHRSAVTWTLYRIPVPSSNETVHDPMPTRESVPCLHLIRLMPSVLGVACPSAFPPAGSRCSSFEGPGTPASTA